MSRIKKIKDTVKGGLSQLVSSVALGLSFLNNHQPSELCPGVENEVVVEEQKIAEKTKIEPESYMMGRFYPSQEEALFRFLYSQGILIINKYKKLTSSDIKLLESIDNKKEYDKFEAKKYELLRNSDVIDENALDGLIKYGFNELIKNKSFETIFGQSPKIIFNELRIMYNGKLLPTIFSSRDEVFYLEETSPYKDVKRRLSKVEVDTCEEEFCLTVYYLLFPSLLRNSEKKDYGKFKKTIIKIKNKIFGNSKKFEKIKCQKEKLDGVLDEKLETILNKLRDNEKVNGALKKICAGDGDKYSPTFIYGALKSYVDEETKICAALPNELGKRVNYFFQKLRDNLFEVKRKNRIIETLSVVSESSCFPKNWIDNRSCSTEKKGCCTLGPYGAHKEVALDTELDRNAGVLRLVGSINNPYSGKSMENVGIAYIFRCMTEKDKLVWLVDTVDCGIREEEIEQDWREIFYEGILKAASDPNLREKPSKLYFNMNVRNEDSQLFNKYLVERRKEEFVKKVEKYVDSKNKIKLYELFDKYENKTNRNMFGDYLERGKKNKIVEILRNKYFEEINKGEFVEIEKIGKDDDLVKAGITHGHYMDTFYDGKVKDSQWTKDCKGTAKVVEIDLSNI